MIKEMIEIKFFTEFNQMIKEFLIELRDYLYEYLSKRF